jgi:hypothetical protein
MKNYRTKILYLLIGFFLFFGFSEFGMAAAAVAKLKLTVVSTSNKGTVTDSSSLIKCGTKCTAMFSKNTVVKLSATAKTGYRFSSWKDGCSGVTCNVKMTVNKKVTAVYLPLETKVKSLNFGTKVDAIPVKIGSNKK